MLYSLKSFILSNGITLGKIFVFVLIEISLSFQYVKYGATCRTHAPAYIG
jgi:hypothetical protein